MRSRLAKPEQRLEHLHLRPRQALPGDRREQGVTVVVPELVVEAPLRRLQVAVNRLLDFLRQLRRDLLLRPPENERPQGAGEQIDLDPIGAARSDGPAECGRGAQEAGVEKLEQAPDLAEMVFDGRPGERQAMTPAQHARRLGRCGRRILDGLRFIENHVVELVFGEPRGVTPQRPVGGEHEVVVGDGGRRSRVAGVVEHAQIGRETRRLVHPVVDQRSRHDGNRRVAGRSDSRDTRRPSSSASTMTVLPRPMSSARQPPNPNRRRNANHPSASC